LPISHIHKRKYNPRFEKDFAKLVEICKQAVIETYEHQPTTERKWLEVHVDSYENTNYKIQLSVLEGSPAKGYVVADYGREIVQAFDPWGKRLKRFTTGHGHA
jgi:hypothetical protein